jgi:hypothetical protein
MRKIILFILLISKIIPNFLLAQSTTTLTQDTINQIGILLNNPTMVIPANATPLGKNWFKIETDIHIFTDQANLQQVASVFLDLENQDKIYNGKRSTLKASIVSRNTDESIVDFVSISFGPFGIQFKTTYRCSVKTITHTDTKISIEFVQLDSDSFSNNDMKNFYSTQYAEEITINNKKYTYIRIYTASDVNAFILPGAKNLLEKEAEPANIEGMQMVINAARNR